MEIIKNRDNMILHYIQNQVFYPYKEYKLFKYIKAKDIDGNLLMYNLFTREIIIFDEKNLKEEKEKYKEFLVEHWFLIPEDMDDKTFVDSINMILRRKETSNKYQEFTITTTTACNATCPYCCESESSNVTMSKEIAIQTAKFIKENSYGEISLRWFGGEPLIKPDIIDIICKELSDINFKSNIVSNGYLWNQFDENTIKNIWRVTRTQFTIDAIGDKYDKIKGIKNSFEITISNIKYLLDMGIYCMVRLNVSPTNTQDLLEVIDYLNIFNGYDNFKIYYCTIYEDWNVLDNNNGLTQLYSMLKIHNRLKDTYPIIRDTEYRLSNHCPVDSGKNLFIFADGNFNRCEHHSKHSSDVYGSVYTSFDYNKEDPFLKLKKEIPECKDCFYYPQCFMLEECFMDTNCTLGYRVYNMNIIEDVMEKFYDKWRLTNGNN